MESEKVDEIDVHSLNLPSSSRIMRNIAEKQRRDKLNGFIGELSTLVPTVASAPRKLDKISTLRLAASYLRLNQCIPDQRIPENGQNVLTLGVQVDDLLIGMDMIQIVLSSCTGKIMYVSENVEDIISYNQVDMLGIPFYSFVHPEDQILVRNQIASHLQTPDFLPGADPASKFKRRKCTCFRIGTRGISRNEQMLYEMATLWGHLKKKEVKNFGKGKDRARHKSAPPHEIASPAVTDWVFVGAIKLLDRRLPERLTLLDSLNDVYVTKHTPDAKIINSDHRISTITGYLAGEVLGKSALCYISNEDLPLVGTAMRMMLTSSAGEGFITYRLITSSGLPVYLRSHGIVDFDPATKCVKGFACVNSVIGEEEWKKEMAVMRQQLEKFDAAEIEAAAAGTAMLPVMRHEDQLPTSDTLHNQPESDDAGASFSMFPVSQEQIPLPQSYCELSLRNYNAAVTSFSAKTAVNLDYATRKTMPYNPPKWRSDFTRYAPYESVSQGIYDYVSKSGYPEGNPRPLELIQNGSSYPPRAWTSTGAYWGRLPDPPFL